MQRLTAAGSPLSTREGETTGNVTVPESRCATPGGYGTSGLSGHRAPRCHGCCSTPHLSSLQGAAALLRRKQALGPTAQRHRTRSSWSVYCLGLGMIHWPGLKTRKPSGEQSCGPSGLRSPGVTAQRHSKLHPSDPEEADPKSPPQHSLPLGNADLPRSQSHCVMGVSQWQRGQDAEASAQGVFCLPDAHSLPRTSSSCPPSGGSGGTGQAVSSWERHWDKDEAVL